MKYTKLQVINIEGQMEMSWDNELIYSGPILNALDAVRRISNWSHLDMISSVAIWKGREELTA